MKYLLESNDILTIKSFKKNKIILVNINVNMINAIQNNTKTQTPMMLTDYKKR